MSPTSPSNGNPQTINATVTVNGKSHAKSAGLSEGEYASKVQNLIQLIDDLRALGAEAVIDLPGIAVIGNQSAGKSSLVEAVSAISVPRNANTCTRCPMECRLKHSTKAWNCQIRLRRKRDTDLDAHSFGMDSKAKAREEIFGTPLTNKSELEPMIRRAQLAILNPSLPVSQFVDMTEKEVDGGFVGNDGQLQFSPDVVCLDITSPDVTNLSFIDLPGIISFDEEENVALVENMVKDHIRGNTLILLTITMKEDIQLQKAAGLAKDADPQGLRTIGVLTKPDTLQEGEEDNWLEILTGKGALGSKYKLHNGYFVTKQPALAELKVKLEHSEARAREKIFFETTSPWKDLPKRTRDRMGVPNLTVELSRLLSQLIEKSLPDLRKKARQSLLETQSALDELPPPPPENPVLELSKLSTAFANDVNKSVWGASGYEDISQHCRKAYDTFMKDILSTRPNFFPKLRSEVDDLDDLDVLSTIEEAEGLLCESEPVFLDEVHESLQKSLTRELPYNVPFSAKARLIRKCFTDWHRFSLKCFNSVKDKLASRLSKMVKEHYERYTRGGLEDEIRRIVEGELDRLASETKSRIKWLLELEDTPFTKNDHYFASYREAYLAKYKQERNANDRLYGGQHNPEEVDDALASLARIGHRVNEADLAKLNDSDPFEQELIVMSEVSAYFRIAYKRIIDNLPRVIDHDFLRALDESILEALNKRLGVGETDAIARAHNFLKDEPDVVASREELTGKKERLEEIVGRLDRFYV